MGEESTLKDRFQYSIRQKSAIGSVMKYHEVKDSDYYRSIVFVEGSSDRRFYKNTGIRRLSKQSYYIYAVQDEDLTGKKAVISAYQYISADADIRDGLEKCIFIVDRDWDLLPKGVSVTRGHSMENYFLLQDNLKILFSHIGKNEKEYDTFWRGYGKFCAETAEFWALKASVVYAHGTDKGYDYRRKRTFEEIFDFRLLWDDTIVYNRKYMEEEIALMRRGIAGSEELLAYCENMKEKIRTDISYIRGHEAFRYLQCYFKEKFGVELDLYARDERLMRTCIRKFKVELIDPV